ncbi:hypothetical protein FSP39_009248 [Pinctada imbricata]|uniref:ADP-ribosylation factor-binding protein GGA1 n=1 Tax=Pinctada imbricata TaxID=66713 RepID=A0AA88Y5X7_PINIB|nr:hypothetical protein FSP39_009248 [Pinctada imbricata]
MKFIHSDQTVERKPPFDFQVHPIYNATNPAMRDVDWEYITNFCDQVNKELEGPQIAVRLIAHKVQSPQEREALYALTTLESCVKNCGRRFHQEIGKFKFLNELIKVVSPKYLGARTTDKVKKRCIELMYSWSKGLPHETKVAEAYKMLKTQGIVKEDPVHVDQTIDHVPPPKPRTASFEDEEKSKLLAKLLKSKNPHDLQAANRLIKNMVKQDADKMEKVSRRINELETINNNVKLLSEMLQHYDSSSSSGEKDMMKELYDSLEKLRPNLFRLASDADEKDNDAITDILKSNDEVMRVMALYKKQVEGITEENGVSSPSDGLSHNHAKNSFNANSSALLDLSADQAQVSNIQSSSLSTEILDEELLALGLKDETKNDGSKSNAESLLGDLDDIFSSTNQSQAMSQPPQNVPTPMFPMGGGQPTFQAMNQPIRGPVPNYSLPQSLSQGFTPVMTQVPQGTMPAMGSMQGFTGLTSQTEPKQPPTEQQQKALDDLDLLGQNLMQQSLPKDSKIKTQDTGQQQKKTLNQMVNTPSLSQNVLSSVQPSPFDAALAVSPPTNSLSSNQLVTTTTLSPQSTAGGTVQPLSIPSPTQNKSTQEVQPLTDVFVPLEKIQPGSATPVNAYDKNGLKIVIHFAKDKPREDVTAMVVSTISTNTNPVKHFMFQAAVPKIMKVKLQPPSATDLPAYNPILPPAAITQVMLVANPQKEKIRLKFKITYSMNDENCSDIGEIESAPL